MAKNEESLNAIHALYAETSADLGGISMLLLGAPGLGKTRFSIDGAPMPVIIDLENGSKRYKRFNEHLKRIDASGATWEELLVLLELILKTEHKTVIIDTADAAAEALKQYLLRKYKVDIEKDSLVSAGRGYGHAYEVMQHQWRRLLTILNKIVNGNKHVIFICHVDDRVINKPNQREITKQVIRLPKQIVGLTTEWAEIIGHMELQNIEGGASKRCLYVDSEQHVMSKNRFSLPEPILYDQNFGTLLKLIEEHN